MFLKTYASKVVGSYRLRIVLTPACAPTAPENAGTRDYIPGMTASSSPHDDRLQETEIRLAFLERELELYKEAVQTLHARLETVEHALARLRQRSPDTRHDPEVPGAFQERGAGLGGEAERSSGLPG
ncbi:MAG TPA: hypothetical protein VKZ88_06540 [Fibrobacteria bacterium]|nr:hypothetical protein [Fibrobacteria bacterium]